MTKWKLTLKFLAVLCCSLALTGCDSGEEPVNVTDALPQDGIYSETEGSGGSYVDPIHGFFMLEPPTGFEIIEKRNKTTVTVQPGRPHAGEKLPRSWIKFVVGKGEIGVITRKTYTPDIETDFDYVLNLLKKNMGCKMLLTRFVTIDGVKGAEYIGDTGRIIVHGIKFKKHGRDHAITLTCPRTRYELYKKEYLALVKTYRSIMSEQVVF